MKCGECGKSSLKSTERVQDKDFTEDNIGKHENDFPPVEKNHWTITFHICTVELLVDTRNLPQGEKSTLVTLSWWPV